MQHICQTSVSANLYQISALVWSVQFVVNFSLASSEQHRNEECAAALEELFGEIEVMYRQKLTLLGSESNRPQSDQNITQPFILQRLDNEENLPLESDSGYCGTVKSNPFIANVNEGDVTSTRWTSQLNLFCFLRLKSQSISSSIGRVSGTGLE